MLACTGQILSHAIIDNVLFDIYSYTRYASLRGLSQNTIVPSLAISTLCRYVSSTSSASTMPEYCFAFFGHIDTLPLELFASWAALPLGLASWAILPLGLYINTLPLRLCLIDIVCFDNAGILICLLGCFCLLSHFASLGFISTLCLLDYVSSTLSALTMPVY
jgi:hypothetical protein